jgi:hypothetical protein
MPQPNGSMTAMQNHGDQDRDRETRPFPAHRLGALDLTHQQEISGDSMHLRKRGMCLDQEGVARPKHDVADLLLDPHAGARDSDHYGVVARAKPAITDTRSDQRTIRRHHRLDQGATMPRHPELPDLVGGRNKPP